ncbi:MAG: SDR family NAD(P)-dependent oxidoreductase, partial [Hyphomicrobiales bacterium]|nr:SDR family NAD(P)-dependent oxidoreductase [Hyphomicrobiales bacterium]
MARGLADAGARLILNGRDERKLAAAVRSLEQAGHRVAWSAFDVADDAAVRAAFARFDADGVAIDILVNNAGNQLRKPMVEVTTEEWRRVIDTHLTAAFQVAREAARRMIARGQGGKIINVGSLASEIARSTIAPYT